MPKVRVFRPSDFSGTVAAPDLPSYYPVLLAEGDSWFTLGSIPAHNMLEGLDFPTFGAAINLANPGDTMADMEKALKTGAGHRRVDLWASEFGSFVADSAAYPLSAIVLSGGGNDLIEALPHLLKRNFDFGCLDETRVAEAIDPDALARFDRYLTASFTGIVDFVRTHGGPNAHIPIFCHTYDYPTPNDAPATIMGARVGEAWIYPRLIAAGVPKNLWVALTDYLIRHLAATLRGLRLEDFHVVNTLDTLVRARPGATGESGDWDNEIHPTRAGYKKLGRKLAQAISDELGLQERAQPVP